MFTDRADWVDLIVFRRHSITLLLLVVSVASLFFMGGSPTAVFVHGNDETVTVTSYFPRYSGNASFVTAAAVACSLTTTTTTNVTAMSTNMVGLSTIFVLQVTVTTTVPERVLVSTMSTTLPMCIVYEPHTITTVTIPGTFKVYKTASSLSTSTVANVETGPQLPFSTIQWAILIGLIVAFICGVVAAVRFREAKRQNGMPDRL